MRFAPESHVYEIMKLWNYVKTFLFVIMVQLMRFFLFLEYIVNKRLILTRSIPRGQSHQSLHCLHMQKQWKFYICIFLLSKAYTCSTSISDLTELGKEIQML